jgi:hypothetical protein
MRKRISVILFMCIALFGILVGVSTGNNNADNVDAATKAVELGSDVISYDYIGSTCMQIPSEDNGGIYFLNGNELSFYNLEQGKVTKKETLLYNNGDSGTTSMKDAYVCGNKLYVLLGCSCDDDFLYTEVVIYDLKNQCVSDRKVLKITVNTIAVDPSGRFVVYEFDGDRIYLVSSK